MTTVSFRAVPTTQLVANTANVREELTGIEELAASIRANGILQPLIVNDARGRLVVTDGHRRLAAAKLAMVPAVPCLVTTGAGQRQVVATMLATAMHKELTPIEQAKAFKALTSEGMTVADVACSTGYTQATIKGRLLLLELPAEAQRMVEDKELTLGDATDLAKQVKAKKSGSVAKQSAGRSAWFTKSHRLAATVADRCSHDSASRTFIGAVACGQCWEDAIRADERGELEVVPVYDEVAVMRAMEGSTAKIHRADRLEALRRLHRQGMSDSQIAERLHCTDRQVIRDRQTLGLPSNFPEYAHTQEIPA